MIIQDVRGIPVKEKVQCKCDSCNKGFDRRLNSIKALRNKRGVEKDYCGSCACRLSPKPQNSKEYWTDEKRERHGESFKHSEKYKIAIKNRPIAGVDNPMYGKKHTDETKKKMSISRTGKVGSSSTAWKGGKTSLNKKIRKILHTRYNWYFRIYQRDGFKCQECGSKKKLDAHHLYPLSRIIKELDSQNIEWLCEQPEIVDSELKNGITLCRECHKQKHESWGSHNANTRR